MKPMAKPGKTQRNENNNNNDWVKKKHTQAKVNECRVQRLGSSTSFLLLYVRSLIFFF